MNLCNCVLCQSSSVSLFSKASEQFYFQCESCRLVFLDPEGRLDPGREKTRYEQHENDPSDAGYRDFLNRLMQPLLSKLPRKAKGLDYGSGPGPTLSVMFQEKGHEMSLYDPYFSPDSGPLREVYDFITCSETAEHFYRPFVEFEKWNQMLRSGGWVGMMTEPLSKEISFGDWYYRKDPTHVCFYRPETFEWIAGRFAWKLERPSRSVQLFQKPVP